MNKNTLCATLADWLGILNRRLRNMYGRVHDGLTRSETADWVAKLPFGPKRAQLPALGTSVARAPENREDGLTIDV